MKSRGTLTGKLTYSDIRVGDLHARTWTVGRWSTRIVFYATDEMLEVAGDVPEAFEAFLSEKLDIPDPLIPHVRSVRVFAHVDAVYEVEVMLDGALYPHTGRSSNRRGRRSPKPQIRVRVPAVPPAPYARPRRAITLRGKV